MAKLTEIIEFLDKEGHLLYPRQHNWNPLAEVTGISQHWNAQPGDIAWTLEKEYKDFNGTILLLPEDGHFQDRGIICRKNKLAFIKVLNKFFYQHPNYTMKIYPTDDINVGKNVTVGHNTIIGAEGFGHEKDDGVYLRFPHFGKVIIGNNVEIGSNVTIQRGTLGNTIIGSNVRIWHQVNIGHNVEIGNNSVILNGSVICGSVKIGNGVWISPSATVMNKVKIGDKSVIGIGSVVTKDVPRETIVAGNPARFIRKVDENTHIMRSHRR